MLKDNPLDTYAAILGLNNSQAIEQINKKLNTNYSTNRFYTWRAGIEPIPNKVLKHIQNTILDLKLIKTYPIKRIKKALIQPDRK